MVDWGNAFFIALIGFAGVFAILTILAIVIMLVNSVIHRMTTHPGNKQKD